MSETKMVYVVTSGSYEDYRIVALFTDKVKAEEFAAENKKIDHDTNVEEWPIDDKVDARAVVIYRSYVLKLSGTARWCDRETRMTVLPEGACYTDVIESDLQFVAQSSVSSEHATKLAVEARQAWQRNNQLKCDELNAQPLPRKRP
jgi:hypothetical protein